jgi:putative DNA primase/helicase
MSAEWLPHTDYGNAKRVVRYCRQDIRYSKQNGWMVWDGTVWRWDEQGAMKYVMEALAKIAQHERRDETDAQKALEVWARKSQDASRISSAMRLARTLDEMRCDSSEIDQDKMILNCKNGPVNLRTGKLLEPDREMYLTQLANVEYQPGATCPLWHEFLYEIMGGDDDLIRSLQMFVGYSLTGRQDARCMFILFGSGANGKSVFLDTLCHLLGSYATVLPAQSILTHKVSSINSNDLAGLAGTRLVVASESEAGGRLNETRVKEVTGNMTLKARFLHKEFFEFTPQFKLWLATNYKPVITGTDDAIWDRIKLIPFAVRIPEEQRDGDLIDKLVKQGPGILNWAVEGALAWQAQERKLHMAQRITEETWQYRADEDQVGQFLEECVVTSDSEHEYVSAKDLYEAYASWAKDYGYYGYNIKRFRFNVETRGIKYVRRSSGYLWLGINLKWNQHSSDIRPFARTLPGASEAAL